MFEDALLTREKLLKVCKDYRPDIVNVAEAEAVSQAQHLATMKAGVKKLLEYQQVTPKSGLEFYIPMEDWEAFKKSMEE